MVTMLIQCVSMLAKFCGYPSNSCDDISLKNFKCQLHGGTQRRSQEITKEMGLSSGNHECLHKLFCQSIYNSNIFYRMSDNAGRPPFHPARSQLRSWKACRSESLTVYKDGQADRLTLQSLKQHGQKWRPQQLFLFFLVFSNFFFLNQYLQYFMTVAL